ncbi:LuxR C-terminal-related transcriptional regulator [Nocardia sp. NPDC052254]|uniref:LuxR C-terminal-related transcriptional regulator n=1 Tax=Nocardia sp. NPDC052254 TaxID=3155681 RepID=UPI0034432210
MTASPRSTHSIFDSSSVANIRSGLQPGIPKLCVTALPLPAARTRIDEAAAAGGHTVLICAPAGSGKTVLATDWVTHRCESHVGWLTCTGRPGESTDLWRAIASVLDLPIAAPNSEEFTAPLAEPARLIDRLAQRHRPTVLILDDAHLLTDPIALAGLEYLVTNAPPDLTTIVTGRFDPPVRWHTLDLTGRLTRLGARELELDEHLTARLFDQHDLHLSDTEIAGIRKLTCGWAALVRIAAIYLAADSHDRAAALAALAQAPHAVSDFLVGELLASLSEDALNFLLTTAVPEEFTVELATELVGDTAAATLEQLLRNNLPIKAVARDGEVWHSYHPMLHTYLLAEGTRCLPDRIREIHRGCATWYVATRMPATAFHHILAEPGRPNISRFIREHGPRLVFGGDGPGFLARLDEIGELADDQFVQLLRIAESAGRADIAAAGAYLNRLLAEPYPASALVPAAWLAILRDAVVADVANATGEQATMPVPATLTPTGHADLDCYIVLQSATAQLHRGEIERAESGLWHALALAERAGLGRFVVRAAADLALCGGFAGRYTVMSRRAAHALDLAEKYGLQAHPAVTEMDATIDYVRYLQGDPVESGPAPIPDTGRLTPAPAAEQQAMAVHHLIESDSVANRFIAADALRLQLLEILTDRTPTAPCGNLLLHAVLVLLRIQSRVSAQTLTERAAAVLGRTPEIVVAEAALSEYAQTSSTTLELLRPLLTQDDRLSPITAVTGWLFYASACDHLDRPVKTYGALSHALRHAAADRIVRPFVDVPGTVALLDGSVGRFGHHDMLVDRIRAHPLARSAGQGPKLTETEISVLRQLPSGMTTLNIAEGMGVSINTVKTHLRGIYHKLGSGSRAAAISRARELGLI